MSHVVTRVAGAALVAALWLGLTVTTAADGAAVRPGDSVAADPLPESLAEDAPARALPRLLATANALTGPAGKTFASVVDQVNGMLAPHPPAADAEADEATVQALGPVTETTSVRRTSAAAEEGLTVAAALAKAALTAPAGQATRLLAGATALDAASRTALKAAGVSDLPDDAGLAGVAASLPAVKDSQTQAITQAFAGGLCTGDNAVPIPASPAGDASGTASAAATDGTQAGDAASGTVAETVAVEGLPTFAEEGNAAVGGRADLLHTAAAGLGRYAYAASVVGERNQQKASIDRADQLEDLTRTLQAAQPAGCAPVVTATAGKPSVFIENSSSALSKARTATRDLLLEAAAATTGEARQALVKTALDLP